MKTNGQARTLTHLSSGQALVAFGANLGERKVAIQTAISTLEAHPLCRVLEVSPIFKTAPVDAPVGSGEFLNGVLLLHTELNSAELLELLHKIESDCGRTRSEGNAPRTLDLDLLVYGREYSEAKNLSLPHPRMHERLFVLDPLAQLCPELQLARADHISVRARQLELRLALS